MKIGLEKFLLHNTLKISRPYQSESLLWTVP